MTADFRALCAEMLDAIDSGIPVERIKQSPLAVRVDAALAQPEPTGLPPGYIDPEHTGADRHLLQVFYRACQAEGGTADEIHLRGIRAVLADAALAQPENEELIRRLFDLAVMAVDSALEYTYGDPEDYHIYRELQELKAAVAAEQEAH